MPGVAETGETVADSGIEDFHAKYILGSKLGRGAFGQVRIASPSSKRIDAKMEDRAVKILDLRDKEDLQKISMAHTEASVWVKAHRHANVVQLHEVFYDSQFCYLVMEMCAGGLFQYMDKMPDFNERSVGKMLAQMLQGLAHVHSVGIVHRDVKADNYLVGGEDRSTVKLTDFGLSAVLPSSGQLWGGFGSAPYMSPEMLKGQCHDTRTDVWSIAVLAYTLLFGKFPYTPKKKSSKGMKQAIVQGGPPKFQSASSCVGQPSEDAVAFVRLLLNRDPAERPYTDEALKLRYIVSAVDKQRSVECELPSLRPTLYSAKKAGAFEFHDLTKSLEIDGLLDTLQDKKYSPCTLLGKKSQPRGIHKQKSTKAWSERSSTSSNIWSKACGVVSTASGDKSQSRESRKQKNSKAWSRTSSASCSIRSHASSVTSTASVTTAASGARPPANSNLNSHITFSSSFNLHPLAPCHN
jgi:serine/threonine protein kinase